MNELINVFKLFSFNFKYNIIDRSNLYKQSFLRPSVIFKCVKGILRPKS